MPAAFFHEPDADGSSRKVELITGAHIIIESTNPEADRSFFKDVLAFDSVDAGQGWLIFSLSPAEVAVHPGTNGQHQLYLMCSDIEAVLAELGRKGVHIKSPVTDQNWGRIASIELPGGAELAIYQPKHPLPPH